MTTRALYRSTTCNVQFSDSAADVRTTLDRAWPASDVLKLQEAWKDYTADKLRALPDASFYRPEKLGQRISIVWRDSVFAKLDAGIKVCFEGGSGSPVRGITWVLLKHKATGKRVLEFNIHQIQGAYSDSPERQPIWESILTKAAAEVVRVRAKYPGVPSVISGDMNKRTAIDFPGVNEHEVTTSGIDRFFLVGDMVSHSQRAIVTKSDHKAITCNLEITTASTAVPAPKPVAPTVAKPATPGVTPSPPRDVDVRRRATWRSRPRWRYIAQRLDGNGNLGPIIHPELPLADVTIDDVLTGHNALSGSISPRYQSLIADDGRPLLEEWGTAIWAEESGNIHGGGILQDSGFNGPTWSLDCVGLTGYSVKLPYASEKFFIETDPADIFRHIWAHIQGQRNGNVGLVVDPLKTGLKIGVELKQVEFDTQSGPVSFESGPYKLAWYQDHDLSSNLSSLAADNTFDWHEEHYWDGDVIKHRLRLGYPNIGTRPSGVRFVIGENIMVIPQVDRSGDDYADETWMLGSGEGVKMLRGISRKDVGRLRRVAVSVDSSIRSQSGVNAASARDLAWRYNLDNVTTIVLLDHPHAPLGSVLPGDEIRLEGETGWIELNAMYRVVSRQIKPQEPGRVTLEIVRTDRIAA